MAFCSTAVSAVEKKTNSYKWCFVPLCRNTSISTPEKIFITVPRHKYRRTQWLKSARRDATFHPSEKSVLFCCEDHFNLEEDMQNYLRWKMIGGNIIMKKSALPKLFECQGKTIPKRSVTAARKRMVANIMIGEVQGTVNVEPATQHEQFEAGDRAAEQEAEEADTEQQILQPEPDTSDRGVQVNFKIRFRSSGAQTCKLSTETEGTSPFKIELKDKASSPMKRKAIELFSSSTEDSSHSEGEAQSSSSDEEADPDLTMYQNVTVSLCKKFPRIYLGIPDDCFFIIDIMLKKCQQLDLISIMLTLRKIRQDESFTTLGHQFNISTSYANKLFHKGLPIIAAIMADFIVQPEKNEIFRNLPIPYRLNFSKTTHIIDCFEIEIQKPSNAVHQALTWSDYKKCNTIKYLISATPNGVINFISEGYGGRTSDMLIFENSKFMDTLTQGCGVMADRGFKNIESILVSKKCTLIRPPSVSEHKKPTKLEVVKTKQVASLRIHIERIIRRLREFKMLAPHSCVDKNLVSSLDNIITCACGIVNLQGPIVAK